MFCTLDQSHPTMTYSYEQLSLVGYAQVLKVAAYGSTGRCEKERTKQSYSRIKTRADGTSFPSQVISSQNKIEIFTNVTVHMGAFPQTHLLHVLTISTLNYTMAPRWHHLTVRSTRTKAARFRSGQRLALLGAGRCSPLTRSPLPP